MRPWLFAIVHNLGVRTASARGCGSREGVYGRFEILGAAMHTAPDLFLGELREEAFHLVQPRTTG
jgi:hypothetical protein